MQNAYAVLPQEKSKIRAVKNAFLHCVSPVLFRFMPELGDTFMSSVALP